MDIYEVINTINIERFVISLRRMRFAAYIEVDGSTTYLITNYIPTGISFRHIGRR